MKTHEDKINNTSVGAALEKLIAFVERFKDAIDYYHIDNYYSHCYHQDCKELSGRVAFSRAILEKEADCHGQKNMGVVFLVHESAYESQCGDNDEISVFTSIDEARAYINKKSVDFKHMNDFKMSDNEFSASSGDWFYRTWIEEKPVRHIVTKEASNG